MSDSTGGFRNTEPGLRTWQSLSHLAPEDPMRSFPPSPTAELRAARGTSRQSEVGQWLQDVHGHLDTHLDRLMGSNAQLSYRKTAAQLHDMKHKVKDYLQMALLNNNSLYSWPKVYSRSINIITSACMYTFPNLKCS